MTTPTPPPRRSRARRGDRSGFRNGHVRSTPMPLLPGDPVALQLDRAEVGAARRRRLAPVLVEPVRERLRRHEQVGPARAAPVAAQVDEPSCTSPSSVKTRPQMRSSCWAWSGAAQKGSSATMKARRDWIGVRSGCMGWGGPSACLVVRARSRSGFGRYHATPRLRPGSPDASPLECRGVLSTGPRA